LNEIDGVNFNTAAKNLVRGKYGKIDVNFIGLEELVVNKKAAGRPQDKVDVELLEKDLL